ncbi:MAG: hypothetical protein AB7F96_05195 [Beijerinckiaceae bacterium]
MKMNSEEVARLLQSKLSMQRALRELYKSTQGGYLPDSEIAMRYSALEVAMATPGSMRMFPAALKVIIDEAVEIDRLDRDDPKTEQCPVA